MKRITALLLFVFVLTACVPQATTQTQGPELPVTENVVTPQPTTLPTATPIPATETKLLQDTFLFPCDSNLSNVTPLQKDTSLTLLGSYGEMAVVTAYADRLEVCGLVALTSLENKPSESVYPTNFSVSEAVNAIPLFKNSEDYPRLIVKNDEKLIIDNTVDSDTKDGYYLVFNNDEPISTQNPFTISLRFEAKDVSSIMIYGRPRDWGKDWWQDVTLLEISCYRNKCDISFYDGTSENSQFLVSFENNTDTPIQVLFQDPLGNELDLVFPNGTSKHFKLHAPLFPDSEMEVGAQAGPNSILEVNEYKFQQIPSSNAPQVITPENVTDIKLLAAWGKGIPWSTTWSQNPFTVQKPIQYADNGNIMVVQTPLGVFLYDAEGGEQISSLPGAVISQVSENGKLLATGHTDGIVKVWDIVDLRLIDEYSAADFIMDPTPQPWDKYKKCQDRKEYLTPTVLAFSHNGKLIAAGYCDGVMGVWDVQNQRMQSLIWGGFLGSGDFVFSKDDRYLSMFNFWLNKLHKDGVEGLPGLSGNFQDFDISPDDEHIAKIYCEEKECKITIALLQDDLQIKKSFSLPKSGASPKITYSKDGQSIVVDFPLSGERLTVDANTGEVIATVSVPLPPELPDYHWLVERGFMDGMQKYGSIGIYKGLDGQSILSNGLAWGTTGEEIYWWNVVENTVKFYPQEVSDIAFPATWNFPETEAQSIFFSAGGSQAAWCKDGQLVILFEKTGERKSIPLPLHPKCDGITFSPNGDNLAVWTTDRISLVSEVSGEIQNIAGYDTPGGIIFSPDGSLLAGYSANKEVFLWQVAPLKNIFQKQAYYVETLNFSPDSKILMGVGVLKGSTMHIWNTENGAETRMDVRGESAAFSPERDLLVTGFGDGYIVIWNMLTGEQISIFRAHEEILPSGNISNVYFLPDGTGFITFGADGLIELWGIK